MGIAGVPEAKCELPEYNTCDFSSSTLQKVICSFATIVKCHLLSGFDTKTKSSCLSQNFHFIGIYQISWVTNHQLEAKDITSSTDSTVFPVSSRYIGMQSTSFPIDITEIAVQSICKSPGYGRGISAFSFRSLKPSLSKNVLAKFLGDSSLVQISALAHILWVAALDNRSQVLFKCPTDSILT